MRCLAVLHPPCPGIIGSSKPRFLPLHHLLRRRAKGSLGLRRRAPLKGTRVAVSSKPPPSPVSDSDQQPQISDVDVRLDLQKETEGLDLGWLPSFPHVLTASMANFLFGYHIGLIQIVWNGVNPHTSSHLVNSEASFVLVGRVNETKKVIETIWGESEVEKSIEEIQTVINDDVKNQKTSWLELLVEPNKKVYKLFLKDMLEYMLLFDVPHVQICNFLVGLYFLELVEKFGVGPVYGAFGGVSLMSAVFATYFIVETKGRSLEEIEISMNANLAAKDE
ncbi:Sugar transporter [Musa troglodytarum]|uniref:Sugar transporter n=1 Tax=Musa troglodytarum TaxID=320322 RepID=A0A9E7GPX1_9LILI|nr:Sugar transporter [Musa troglodytarum]